MISTDGTVATRPPSIPTPRLDSLTGLRWWAAFGVFLFHMRIFAPVPVLDAFAPFGNHGVAFFFVLSGFVLTWSARPGTTVRNFYWRRFARIYPAHFVALLLAIPVFYSFAPDPAEWWVKPFSIGILLLSVLLIQGWFSDPAIMFSGNPAAWTLTVEAFFYALHPFVLRVLQLLRMRGVAIFLCTVVVASFAQRALTMFFPSGWWASMPLPVNRLSEFLIGMGIALLLKLGWRPRFGVWLSLALLAVFMVGKVAFSRFGIAPGLLAIGNSFQKEILVMLLAALILAIALLDLRGGRSWMKAPWMVKLGEWSFAFYLVHATAMYFVMSIVGAQPRGFGNLIWYPPVFALALLGAWLLYRFVEHPLELRMRKWGNRKLQPAAPARSAT